ncbi:MAG TPA: TonB family protein, partial [Anaeromyxobacteraceae bacterium]|nr:TonB family protein [Anaeromyxobacteraceae bacterium]
MVGFAAALLAATLAQATAIDGSPAPTGETPPAEPPASGVLTRPPELIQFVPAPYPPEAEGSGVAGSVRLSLVIGEDGAVREVKVIDPGPHAAFAPAAEAAVRQFRFQPAEIDGK